MGEPQIDDLGKDIDPKTGNFISEKPDIAEVKPPLELENDTELSEAGDRFKRSYIEGFLKERGIRIPTEVAESALAQLPESLISKSLNLVSLIRLGNEAGREISPTRVFEDFKRDDGTEDGEIMRTANSDPVFISRDENRKAVVDSLVVFPNQAVENAFPPGYLSSDQCLGYEWSSQSEREILDAFKVWRDMSIKQFNDEVKGSSQILEDCPDLAKNIFFLRRALDGLQAHLNSLPLAFEEVQEPEQGLPSEFNIPTEKLHDEGIAGQTRARDALIAKIFGGGKFQHLVGQSVLGGSAQIGTKDAFNEQELVYGAYLLAPESSTEEFAKNLKQVILEADTNLVYNEDPFISHNHSVAEGIRKSAKGLRIGSFAGKTVLEIGGESALTAMKNMGAEAVAKSDAGHSGYSGSYSAGSAEKMVSLRNYETLGDVHSADVIVSSRLFDLGSGIEQIAEAGSSEEAARLGEEEMVLVMENMLKDGGFMVHFNGLPQQFSETRGIARIGAVSSKAEIYRYHADREQGGTIELGRKRAIFTPDTKIWNIE